jgi:hypothetical protein
MENVRYAINKRTGNYALAEFSIKNIKGIGQQEYICNECGEKLILKKGNHNAHHFAHEAQEKVCSYYSNNQAEKNNVLKIKHDERLHQQAIKQLKMMYETDYKINPVRRCSAKGGCKQYTTDVTHLDTKKTYTKYETEYTIQYNGKNRKLDLVRLDNGKLKYIFEILDCNRTAEENRPTDCEWFEIYADDIIKISSKLDSMAYDMTEGIEIDCKRQIFKCIECTETEKKRMIRIEAEQKQAEAREKERERIILKELEEKQHKEEEIERIRENNRKIQKIEEEQRKAARLKEAIQAQENRAREEVKRQERKMFEEEMSRKQKIINDEKRKNEEKELWEKQLDLQNKDKKCYGCNINHCKCKIPNFIKNEYNIIVCKICIKRKCMCVQIDKFFKKI